MNAIPAPRIPHRVGRRTLRRLVEHRTTPARSVAPMQRPELLPPPIHVLVVYGGLQARAT